MMNKKQPSVSLNTGIVSILMVFSVLCITVFAALSFVQSNAQVKQVKRNMQLIQEYYEADTKAIKIQSEIDSYLLEDNLESCKEDILIQDDKITYSVEINERQKLAVTLVIENQKTKRLQWQMVVSDEGDYGNLGFVD